MIKNTDFDNVIIFQKKREYFRVASKADDIYFSIKKNLQGSIQSKFYIGVNIARELKIDENTKMMFACDKDDNTIWYLIAGDQGYKTTKEKRNDAYSSVITFPFNYIEKRMIKIGEKMIQNEKRFVKMVISDQIKKEELVLRTTNHD